MTKINDFGNAFGQVHRTCKKIFDFDTRKSKTNMAKKKH